MILLYLKRLLSVVGVKLIRRLEERYNNIKYLCTDHYNVYNKYKLAEHHIQSKAETSLVESKNSLVRHYLARFQRKTKRFSKSIDMMRLFKNQFYKF